mgnify:CR=1 FL=1
MTTVMKHDPETAIAPVASSTTARDEKFPAAAVTTRWGRGVKDAETKTGSSSFPTKFEAPIRQQLEELTETALKEIQAGCRRLYALVVSAPAEETNVGQSTADDASDVLTACVQARSVESPPEPKSKEEREQEEWDFICDTDTPILIAPDIVVPDDDFGETDAPSLDEYDAVPDLVDSPTVLGYEAECEAAV